MPVRRRVLERRPVAMPLLLVAMAISGCGRDDPGSEPAPDAVPTAGTGTPPVATAADPLRRARSAIQGGRLGAADVEALAASGDPRALRAARLLEAIAAAFSEDGPAPSATPRIETPTTDPAPTSTPKTGDEGPAARRDVRRADAGARRIRRFVLRRAKPGQVLLSVRADGAVPVGIANQPDSRLVRLVFEGTAAPGMRLPPRHVGGVKVVGIHRATASVFVTIALDAGWRLVRYRRTDRGAKVTFEGPTP
ncbi:MAG: hypothetical protein D6705_04275 [Deltaproteobacteria bacterium]|nr:MAG: hypothetical protein D6705_04275 [Deltaproteobacteria bacterium]